MAIITFDCDEVLADLMKSVLHRHDNTFLGIPLEWHEIDDYFLENIPRMKERNVSIASAKAVFDAAIVDYHATRPVEGMQAIVRALKKQGHELYVVTARGDDLQEATTQRIQQHYPNMFSDIILTNHYHDNKVCKGDVCSYVGSALMIEDTIHNAEKVIAKSVPVIIPEKPWNAFYVPSSSLIHKANDAQHIEQILVEKGFL